MRTSEEIIQIMIDMGLTYEEIGHMLYMKGDMEGYSKVTDKTKWRELVVAEKLGHIAHKKISAGAGTLEYGSDALDAISKRYAEYKSQAILDTGANSKNNLLESVRNKKTGLRFASLVVKGVYNGFNGNVETATIEYAKKDHYFGVFYKELCVLVIKVNTDYVMESLTANYKIYEEKERNGKAKTKNCNSVSVNLGDTHLYEVAYQNETWWNDNK